MWTARVHELHNYPALRFTVDFNSRQATYAEVIRAWQDDADFRSQFNSLLARVPFTAFRWETSAVAEDSLSQPFEFVILDSPGLARRVDEAAFAEHFANANNGVAVFRNLGNDAILVVPSPVVEAEAYGHLAAFVRHAPEFQQQSLWQAVGQAMAGRIGHQPVWLSTAGAGVSWLHVRLDDRPKYYGYDAYRRAPKA